LEDGQSHDVTRMCSDDPCATLKEFNNSFSCTLAGSGVVVDVFYVINCPRQVGQGVVVDVDCVRADHRVHTGRRLTWLACDWIQQVRCGAVLCARARVCVCVRVSRAHCTRVRSAAKMGGGDMYQMSVSVGADNTTTTLVRNAHAPVTPPMTVVDDASQNEVVQTYKGSRVGSVMNVTFKRYLSALYAENVPLAFSAPVYVLLARRESDANFSLVHDGGKFISQQPMQLFTTGKISTGGIDLSHLYLILHGVLMFIAFAVLMPVGTFFARHLKDIGHKWFVTHRAMLCVAVAAALVAFVFAILHVEIRVRETAWRARACVGVFTCHRAGHVAL
jgi:hypothetical protein